MNREIINITNQSSVVIPWNSTRKASNGLFPCIQFYTKQGTPPPTGNTNPYSIHTQGGFFVATNLFKLLGRFADLIKVNDVLQITGTVSNNNTYTVASVVPHYATVPYYTYLTFVETVTPEATDTATVTHTVIPGGYYYAKVEFQAVIDAPPPSTTSITINFNSPFTGFIILL